MLSGSRSYNALGNDVTPLCVEADGIVCVRAEEIERLREDLMAAECTERLLINENAELRRERDAAVEALQDIDTHIRATRDSIPHIVETLKRVLPEWRWMKEAARGGKCNEA